MDVKTLLHEDKKFSFEISGVDTCFLNTLRRLIIEEVPTLAIEEVNFIDNSSGLYDEMVALRLGLVPLKTDLKSYVLPEEAKNEHDPKAFLNFKLKVKGPSNVYAFDLKSQDPKVTAVYDKILILKLFENQHLELEATANLGKGKNHVKFSPGLAYYNHKYKINVKQKDPGEFKNKYPPQIFDKDGKIDSKLITPQLIDACKNVNNEIIEVKEIEDSFEFYLESWGQLEVKEIFSQAIEIFNEKLDSFEKELKKVK